MQNIVLQPDDPKLRSKCTPITKSELMQTAFQVLIEEMLDFVYQRNNKGENRIKTKAMTVGLSANQIGGNKQIAIVDLAVGKKNYSDIHIFINPEIVWKSKSTIEKCEGCVNLPNVWGYINRSKRIKVKTLDRSGNQLLLDLTGWPAVVMQHEIDHLRGILFIDHLTDPKHALLVEKPDYLAFKKAKKNWSKFINVSHLIPTNQR